MSASSTPSTIRFETLDKDRYVDPHFRTYDLPLSDELRVDPAAIDVLIRQGTERCQLSLRRVKKNRMLEIGAIYDLPVSGLLAAARPVAQDGLLWLVFPASILQVPKRRRAVRR